MKLILFDIDGTLVNTGGAGSRALNIVFREYFSIDNAFKNINMAGKTDVQIIKEGLADNNLKIQNGLIEELSNLYIKTLSIEINNNRKRIMPGVKESLRLLSNQKNLFNLGLLTGNMEQGARIKLEAFDLNKYFSFGAFGSDDEDRNKLLPYAIKRFHKIYNREVNFSDCVVIGDTPRDVECAKPYGAYCIAVATGPYTVEHLQNAGAHVVMKNLSNTLELMKSIENFFK